MDLTAEQKAELTKQIAEIRAQRDQIVEEANRQIAYSNGRIDQLEAMLKEAEPQEVEGKE